MEHVDDETGEVMLEHPREESRFRGLATQDVIPPNMQLTQRQVSDLFGAVQVAQLVPVPRNVENVMKKMAVMATQFGDKYVYSWEVKGKNGKELIEGGTVDLAYDLAREYGNNCVDVREIEKPGHWVFYARFTDLETGYTTTRAFQQRKSQSTGGRMDADRMLDIAYQIGQSKAIRNVVLKALSSFGEYCIEEAKRGMYDKIKANPEKYLKAIERGLEKFDIAMKDVERHVSRVKADWTFRDIANVFAKLKAVDEGMANAKDAFPKDTPQIAEPGDKKPAEKEPDRETKNSVRPTQTQNDAGDGAAKAEDQGTSDAGRSEAQSTGKSPASDQTPAAAKAKEPEAKPAVTSAKKPAARPKALFDDKE